MMEKATVVETMEVNGFLFVRMSDDSFWQLVTVYGASCGIDESIEEYWRRIPDIPVGNQ